MKCEELVGPATATGQRRQCSRKALYLASYLPSDKEQAAVAVCGHHASDFRRSSKWVIRWMPS